MPYKKLGSVAYKEKIFRVHLIAVVLHSKVRIAPIKQDQKHHAAFHRKQLQFKDQQKPEVSVSPP